MKKSLAILALLGVLPGCGESPPPEPSPTAPGPASKFRLVLVLAVDQFRMDYLERFAPAFHGGLARLVEEGVLFVDGHQDHAVTNTGPGHASIATGTYPSRSGIITNQWFDKQRRTSIYCVGDANWPVIGSTAGGRSPNNLLVSALPDWIKERWPDARVFAASFKDRASILLGGHGADAAYWYSGGDFVTSTYYRTTYPDWVSGFNARNLPERTFGKLWESLSLEEDVRAAVSDGIATPPGDRGFPHAFGSASLAPDAAFYTGFATSPMMDEYLAEFARELIVREELGQHQNPDYLGLSFSAPDLVGHRYGPDSPEILDTLVRLDRTLGDLLDFIDEQIGLDKTLLAFSSDHGVCPVPEYRQALGQPGRRADDLDTVCIQNEVAEISARLGMEAQWLLTDDYLDYESIAGLGLEPSRVEQVAAEVLQQCPSIRKVWTRSELLSESKDPFHRLFANSFHPVRSPDLNVQLEEYHLATSLTASHGSPYPYDTHVPILFALPGITPKRVQGRVRTIDIAPTLAELLGIPIPDSVQGRSLVVQLGREPGPD